MLKRDEVIQRIVDLFQSPRYLEIGVDHGHTFHKVRAASKVAVDPTFRFSNDDRELGAVKYFEMTSDAYFGNELAEDRFDVIFIDGLHTFEQTLRDLISAVSVLNVNGVVIVDDVIPTSYHASLPDLGTARQVRDYLKDGDPSWMGDVFKLVFFVQTFFQIFDYATVQDNHGQMLIWRSPRSKIYDRLVSDFTPLSFSDVVLGRKHFNVRPFDEIVNEIVHARISTDR